MFHVAVIGAGNLGSRHLQALALTKIPFSVEVVEPSEESLQIAKTRWEEMPVNFQIQSIEFYSAIDELSPIIDVAIVATSSGPRRIVIEELLRQKTVRYFLLEKVLFQRMKDFEEIQALFAQKGVKAWVNCVRRNVEFYRSMAEELRQNYRIDMTVFGADWGLGCNSIHMLDLYSMLSGAKRFSADIEHLDDAWSASKRKGYIEFTGTLRIQSEKGTLSLRSDAKGEIPSIISIQSEKCFCVIDESKKIAWMLQKRDDDWSWVEFSVDIRNQSEVTHEIVQDLIEKGDCVLTPYTESMLLHKPLIEAFLAHMNRFTEGKTEVCPIT